MLAEGKIRSVIDRTYKFSEVPEAIRYVETGRARGKVVVSRVGGEVARSGRIVPADRGSPSLRGPNSRTRLSNSG